MPMDLCAQIQRSFDQRYTSHARHSLDELPDSFTITDPHIPGHPIVFASPGFLKLTGYARCEVLGKTAAIFQGPGTSRRSVMEIREAVREERTEQVVLLNYRKDGTPFWMLFCVCPVFSGDGGAVVHFVAVQVPLLKKDGSGVRDFGFGCCRKEVCTDSLSELGRVCSVEQVLERDVIELEREDPCVASDEEMRSAVTAMDNIFSVLTHFSEATGRLVCRKRCSVPDVGLLSTSLIISLGRIKQSFVLTNPHLPDMPIVYASDAFLKLTGYGRSEVLGRNCRFLGGTDTDTSTLYLIKESIKAEQPCTVRILNYRKDESSFWNFLHISPVRDASGKVAYFVGVQIEDSNKNDDRQCLSPEKRQLSVVGVVKVAVRSLSMSAGSSKS
ncbi:protein TWIN LOV 1 isoform X1 [Vigna radiata var. radiata]|uniref:Protein TWIN LOV 1 isoform X1 n=1 Tax=Vigna radiata var. radiata TaxID=3916 RepID=A0A1S3VSI7_VIGRR|nr:protein TWIN LOV 1 isoform X1 [Vigna radiata var. radiata]XP_022643105.1 protein TWIN LOV 1 isoform X1 [Vigna radiata var. radiata]